jgi:hypothetical protein
MYIGYRYLSVDISFPDTMESLPSVMSESFFDGVKSRC